MTKFIRLVRPIHALYFLIILGIIFGLQIVVSKMVYSADNVTVSDSDNGGNFQIEQGGILTLKLGIRPGTGYVWQISNQNYEPLKLLGEPKFKQNGVGKPGASEQQIFQFKALKHGTSIIKLHYVREWEKPLKPLNSFRVTVEIN
jgi:predicted secreted protein